MNVLDLFMGTGSATQPFRECPKGHRVVGVDLVGPAEIRCDVRKLPRWVREYPWDCVWMSDPCQPYSLAGLARQKHERPTRSELELTEIGLAIATAAPRWARENVRGALAFAPPPTFRYGSRYIWTNVPVGFIDKMPPSKYGGSLWNRPEDGKVARLPAWLTGQIPPPLSNAFHRAVCEEAE